MQRSSNSQGDDEMWAAFLILFLSKLLLNGKFRTFVLVFALFSLQSLVIFWSSFI